MLKYKLRKIGRKKVIFWSATILIFLISMTSIIRYYAINASFSALNSGNSGIQGNIVYVNDWQKDYDYYMGMNFTEITGAKLLPSGTNSNRYNDNNLIPVEITYDGQDVNNASLVGRISNTETQSMMVYYKYYVLENNKIKIDLIDNPFTSRPNGYGFHGWACDPAQNTNGICNYATLSYDDDYYQRYVTIDLSSFDKTKVRIHLNAYWIPAKTYTLTAASGTGTHNVLDDAFDFKTMTNLPTTPLYVQYQEYTKHVTYSFKQGVTYYTRNNNYYNQYYGQYNDNTTYYIRVSNNNYREAVRSETTEDFNVNINYSWDNNYTDTVENGAVGNRTTVEYSKAYTLYYASNGNHNNQEGYYTSAGLPCGASNCGSSAYKLIQSTDSFATNLYTTYTPTEYNNNPTHTNPVEGDRSFTTCYYMNGTNRVNVDCTILSNNNYRYFPTRDTNILTLNYNDNINLTNVYSTRPFTISSAPFGTGTVRNVSGSLTARNDLVLEHVRTSSALSINGAGYNFKVGRDVAKNNGTYTASSFLGQSGNSTDTRYTLIVESGEYNDLYVTNNATQTNQVVGIIGSDYDRVNGANPDAVNGGDNRKLRIYNRLYSTAAVSRTTSDYSTPFATEYVKSGCIGCNTSYQFNSDNSNNTAGAYMVSNQQNVNVLATSRIVVYGGYLKTIQGGAGYSTTNASNAVDIRVAGGTVGTIFAGARLYKTYGNRIVTITGGNILFNVFGGSNANDADDNEDGVGDFNSLVYVGGNAKIGATPDVNYTSNYVLFANTTGNVFGAGNGRNGYNAGAVNNSHVVINGGTIEGDVYGGGNYGAVGSQTSAITSTVVEILSGSIEGNVYGGANRNGAGDSPSNTSGCSCGAGNTVCLTDSYYIRGNTVTNSSRISNGTYYVNSTSLYDGMQINRAGNGTRCNNGGGCITFTAVDYGDAYNSSIQYYTIESPWWSNNYYLYFENNPNTCTASTSTSSMKHQITITMTGGTVKKSVYGGANITGKAYADVLIDMIGGTVQEDVFGGGRGETAGNNHNSNAVMGSIEVNAKGTTIRDVYGGSALGRVNGDGAGVQTSYTTTVNISAGTINNVYGCGMGENTALYPYTNGKATVNVTGGTMKNVYGGNNTSGTAVYPSEVNLTGGTINENAYGGGNNVKHGDTNITLDGANVVGDLFGGSNKQGDNGTTNVSIKSGTVSNVFGGNNAGGTVSVSKVVVEGITNLNGDIYGSGLKAATNQTNVTIKNNVKLKNAEGVYKSVYGGGKQAAAATTNVLVENGQMLEVYGGSNESGIVDNSYVYISNGTIENVFGGNNSDGNTKTTHVYIGGGTIHKLDEENKPVGGVYGGGQKATTTVQTNVYTYGGNIDAIYGGGSEASVVSDSNNTGTGTGGNNTSANTNVYVYGGTVPNIFGGSNKSGEVTKTNVTVEDTAVNSCATRNNVSLTIPCYSIQERTLKSDVFGGNNAGGTVDETNVNIKDTAKLNDVFGGGNEAAVLVKATVNMYNGDAENVYGGGNKSYIGDAIEENGAFLTRNGNPGNTIVNIANGTVNKNVYGSGNASFVFGETHVYIGDDARNALGINANTNPQIKINGNVFGGSETNSDESSKFDYSYNGVIGSTNVYINGNNYNNGEKIQFAGSVYGGGNNSAVGQEVGTNAGPSYIYISKFGSDTHTNNLKSIQRGMYVYLTDSVIEFTGDRDRAELTMFSYGFVRVDNLYLLGSSGNNTTGTTLYMNVGCTYLNAYNSGTFNTDNVDSYKDSTFIPQTVSIDNGNVSIGNANNKLFMLSKVLFAVTKEKAPSYKYNGTDAGPVKGMTYFGMFYKRNESKVFGIYDYSLTNAGYQQLTNEQKKLCDLSTSDDECKPYSFVYGYHELEKEEQKRTHGFYSHYESEENNGMYVDYVDVTPVNATYYKWVLGSDIDIIDVSLQATKASVDSAQAVTITLDSLKEMVDGNMVDWHDARMDILAINTDNFKVNRSDVVDNEQWDVALVDKSKIKVINTDTSLTKYCDQETGICVDGNHTVSDANKYFALSMGTTPTGGWLDIYNTKLYSPGSEIFGRDFCTVSTGSCVGHEEYLYDSTTNPRSLSFMLYYSKNLDFEVSSAPDDEEIYVINLGTVTIRTLFTNSNGNSTYTGSSREVDINVNIALVDNLSAKYGAAINSGKHYSVFEHNKPTITDDSAFSIYQMMSMSLKAPNDPTLGDEEKTVEDIYNEDVYRYLTTNALLPVGTTITMLDLKTDEQYYYVVDQTNRNAIIQSQCNNNVSQCENLEYRLEDFMRMGNEDPNIKYDDDMNGVDSSKYFTKTSADGAGIAVEEFIFNVDFSGVEESDRLAAASYYMYLETRNSETNKPEMTPTGMPVQNMVFTIVNNTNSDIITSGGFVTDSGLSPSTTIYNTDEAILEVNTSLVVRDNNNNEIVNGVENTNYNDSKLGARITFMQAVKNDQGVVTGYNPVSTSLFGTVATINGKPYYPQADGSIRLKLAGVMTNVISDISFDFSNSDLEFGDYKVVVQTFSSYDGLYEISGSPITTKEYYLTLLNNDYGIDVSLPPVQITRDSNTGKDKNGQLALAFDLKTKNGLADPNVKVHLERREYGSIYATTYKEVPLENIATSLSVGDGNNVMNNTCYRTDSTTSKCIVYDLVDLEKSLTVQSMTVNMTMKPGPTEAEIANPAAAGWKSGTYRVVFTIYDGDKPIGQVYEYLIIRSLDVDEEIEGS